MNIQELKQYLEEKLPSFTFYTDEETQAKYDGKMVVNPNENGLFVTRDGQAMYLDVSKVDTKAGAKKLKEFIELKWRGTK